MTTLIQILPARRAHVFDVTGDSKPAAGWQKVIDKVSKFHIRCQSHWTAVRAVYACLWAASQFIRRSISDGPRVPQRALTVVS